MYGLLMETTQVILAESSLQRRLSSHHPNIYCVSSALAHSGGLGKVKSCTDCRATEEDILTAMGSMYASVFFLGMQYSSVQPVAAVERIAFYRERASGMYSAIPFPYAFAQCQRSQYHRLPLKFHTVFFKLSSMEPLFMQ